MKLKVGSSLVSPMFVLLFPQASNHLPGFVVTFALGKLIIRWLLCGPSSGWRVIYFMSYLL